MGQKLIVGSNPTRSANNSLFFRGLLKRRCATVGTFSGSFPESRASRTSGTRAIENVQSANKVVGAGVDTSFGGDLRIGVTRPDLQAAQVHADKGEPREGGVGVGINSQ